MDRNSYWDRWTQRRITRRRWLGAAGATGVGVAGLALVGCGDDDDDSVAPTNTLAPGETPEPTNTTAPGQTPAATATATPQSTVKRGGKAVWGASLDIQGSAGLDPVTGGIRSPMWRLVFDSLLSDNSEALVDHDDSLSLTHEVPEPTRIVFELRQGVMFHDDTPFNAEAVKFNIDRAKDPDIVGGLHKGTFAVIDNVEVIDEYTVAFNLNTPDASLIANLGERGGLMASPTHVEKTSLEDLKINPLGSGPYRFNDWQSGSFSSFTPNEQYWRKAPDGGRFARLDEIRMEIIPDAVVLGASIQSGDIDLAEFQIDMSQAAVLDKDEGLLSDTFGRANNSGFLWNMSIPPADNVNFRRALAWAWDADSQNDLVWDGRATVARQLTGHPPWVYKEISDYPGFDLSKAREFLEASGVPEEDRELDVTVAFYNQDSLVQVQDSWSKIGVKLNLIPDSAQRNWKNQGHDPADVHVGWLGGSRADPHIWLDRWLNEKGAYNAGATQSPDVEQLIEKANQTYDLDERAVLYQEIHEIHADLVQNIYMGLYTPHIVYFNKDLTGFRRLGDGLPHITTLGPA